MMDKRLFLAFSLSGLVVVATPFLFPRAKVPPAPSAVVTGDSQRPATAQPAPATGAPATAPATASAAAPTATGAAAPTAAPGAATQSVGSGNAPTGRSHGVGP